jgi:hypothetical protein
LLGPLVAFANDFCMYCWDTMEIAVKERKIAREKIPKDGFLFICE